MGIRRFVAPGRYVATRDLQSFFARRVESFLAAAAGAGFRDLLIVSAHRDNAHQSRIAASAPSKVGKTIARPGYSPHEFGCAVDLNIPAGAYGIPKAKWAYANAARFGLNFGLLPQSIARATGQTSRASSSVESWHMEPVEYRVPSSAGVVTLSNGVTIYSPDLHESTAEYRTDVDYIGIRGATPTSKPGAKIYGPPAPGASIPVRVGPTGADAPPDVTPDDVKFGTNGVARLIVAVADDVLDRYPRARFIGALAKRNIQGTGTPSLHATGEAVDIGVPTLRDRLGTEISRYVVARWAQLGVTQVIWNDEIWTSRTGRWRPYVHPAFKNLTVAQRERHPDVNRLQHRDHVHIGGAGSRAKGSVIIPPGYKLNVYEHEDDLVEAGGVGVITVTRYGTTDVTIARRRKAFLDVLAYSEGTSRYPNDGYNTLLGGRQFSGYADHPLRNVANSKSAAGRYQFQRATWDWVRSVHKDVKDFSPPSQDLAAVYRADFNKGGLEAIDRGDLDAAMRILRGVWTSLPGGPEDLRHPISKLREVYQKSLNGSVEVSTVVGDVVGGSGADGFGGGDSPSPFEIAAVSISKQIIARNAAIIKPRAVIKNESDLALVKRVFGVGPADIAALRAAARRG